MLDWLYKENGSLNFVSALSDTIAAGGQFTSKLVREWTLQLIHNGGKFNRVRYKKRSTRSIIHNPVARLDMTTWVTKASRAMPPAKAADFANYVGEKARQLEYGCSNCTLQKQDDFKELNPIKRV
ncbi:hypothetical protein B484DRAFT_398158 [Ochromonadaceae sp. CCMP2298]|nr:hypothetical protein B484DRAFT_398158 [Ochromonadaceae sp. CCMP2298]